MPAAKKTASRASPARRAPARRSITMTVPADVEIVTPKAPTPTRSASNVKTKVLRDSFRIPSNEYAVLDQLKERAAKAGHPAKKSEVLRAGVKVLAAMGDLAFVTALGAVPPLKSPRPSKS
jgi:hypothetical protein